MKKLKKRMGIPCSHVSGDGRPCILDSHEYGFHKYPPKKKKPIKKPAPQAFELVAFTLDKTHLSQVEHNIAPPMRVAITIPVQKRGGPAAAVDAHGIGVYVASSPFSFPPNIDEEDAVREVARRLEIGEVEEIRDCPDCGAEPGHCHKDGCDVERCSVCGCQRLCCGCEGHDPQFSRWSGFWPGSAEARLLGIDMNAIVERYRKTLFVKPGDEETVKVNHTHLTRLEKLISSIRNCKDAGEEKLAIVLHRLDEASFDLELYIGRKP